MSEKEYISISDYAALKGISKQAVYKQLNNRLKDFLIVVESKKYIKITALNEVEQSRLNEVEQPFEQPLNNPLQPFLQSQIEEKDKLIESLFKQIEVLQEKNNSLTDTIQEQNNRLTDLLYNNQVLLAAEKKMFLPNKTNQEEQTDKKKSFLKRLFSKDK